MIVGIWGAELLKLVLGAALVGAASTAVLLKTVDVDSSAAENSSMTCNAAEKYSTLQLQAEWPLRSQNPTISRSQCKNARVLLHVHPRISSRCRQRRKPFAPGLCVLITEKPLSVAPCPAAGRRPGQRLQRLAVSYRLVLGLSGFTADEISVFGDKLWLPESTTRGNTGGAASGGAAPRFLAILFSFPPIAQRKLPF
jgi:hypothetical protein